MENYNDDCENSKSIVDHSNNDDDQLIRDNIDYYKFVEIKKTDEL